jgi:hypothetical protein
MSLSSPVAIADEEDTECWSSNFVTFTEEEGFKLTKEAEAYIRRVVTKYDSAICVVFNTSVIKRAIKAIRNDELKNFPPSPNFLELSDER